MLCHLPEHLLTVKIKTSLEWQIENLMVQQRYGTSNISCYYNLDVITFGRRLIFGSSIFMAGTG
ncbi:hypothetical protein WG66_002314, partial [Moniliophthora roreri]